MKLANIASRFMDLYWESKWDIMREMVTDDFVWENRPIEDDLLCFDDMARISIDFMEGNERWDGSHKWPGVDVAYSVHLRSIETENQLAQERMDMWLTNGLWTRLPCYGFWTFRDGKIASWNDYWDMQRLNDYSTGKVKGSPEKWTRETASRKFWENNPDA